MSENEYADGRPDDQKLLPVEEGNRMHAKEAAGDGVDSISALMHLHKQGRQVANPDDPPVRRPPRGPQGVLPGPYYLGLPGRIAIVQGQVFIVAIIVIVQLWLVTDALYELLSGRTNNLLWLALASGIGFVLALIVAVWPRRRVERP